MPTVIDVQFSPQGCKCGLRMYYHVQDLPLLKLEHVIADATVVVLSWAIETAIHKHMDLLLFSHFPFFALRLGGPEPVNGAETDPGLCVCVSLCRLSQYQNV